MLSHVALVARGVRVGSLVAVAAVLLLASAATTQAGDVPAGSQQSAEKLERLIKQAGLMYQRIDNPGEIPVFKVMMQDGNGRSSVIFMKALTQRWTYQDGTPGEYVYCFTPVAPASPQRPISPAAVQRVAELTDSLLLVGCSVNSAGVFANQGFVLRGVDAESFQAYVATLHFSSLQVKDALAPLLTT